MEFILGLLVGGALGFLAKTYLPKLKEIFNSIKK